MAAFSQSNRSISDKLWERSDFCRDDYYVFVNNLADWVMNATSDPSRMESRIYMITLERVKGNGIAKRGKKSWNYRDCWKFSLSHMRTITVAEEFIVESWLIFSYPVFISHHAVHFPIVGKTNVVPITSQPFFSISPRTICELQHIS